MTIGKIFAVLAVAALAACGSTSDTVFTATTGSYRTFSAGASSANSDGCNVAWAFNDPMIDPFTAASDPGLPIDVTITGTTGIIDLDPGVTAVGGTRTIAVAINSNAISTSAGSNWEKNISGTDCNYDQTVSVTGDITANDELALTASYTKTRKSGTCTLGLLYIRDPATSAGNDSFTSCTSTIHFLATRTGPLP